MICETCPPDHVYKDRQAGMIRDTMVGVCNIQYAVNGRLFTN